MSHIPRIPVPSLQPAVTLPHGLLRPAGGDWQAGIWVVIRSFSLLLSARRGLTLDPSTQLFQSHRAPTLQPDQLRQTSFCQQPGLSSLNCEAKSRAEARFQTSGSLFPAELIPIPICVFQFWDEPRWDWEFLRHQRPRDSQTDGRSYNSQHQPFLLVCLQQRLHHQLSRVSGWWLFPVGRSECVWICLCVCVRVCVRMQQRKRCMPVFLLAHSCLALQPAASGCPLCCT